MTDTKGIIGSLFDLSFSELVTTKLVKIFYVMAIFFSGLISLAMLIGGFSDSFGSGLVALVVSPIVFFAQILFARIGMEMTIAVFKIAENTSRLVDKN
jgi:hypothetical protein